MHQLYCLLTFFKFDCILLLHGQVIVVEKGSYTPASELSTLEKDAYENLYERGGLLLTTEEGSKLSFHCM